MPRTIERPSEYTGEEAICVEATQNDALTATQKKKLVQEWMDFFESGPTPLKRLDFTTRTPRRLFETLKHQTQLEDLRLKWGDYSDLSPIATLPNLHTLKFQSAPAVKSVEPLTGNSTIRTLQIHGLRDAHDMSPLGTMTSLRNLHLGGDGNSLRVAHIDSLEFIYNLPQLEELMLQGLIVDSKDYSPLLSLKNLKLSWVMASRGMRPKIEELSECLGGWVD
ncbi:hypothetical protein ACSYDW_08675 [Paeniglutamicibacter sp. R2-26]|uniref:hypothetical protein n=1 Tax=Paeniglutamicibacter sp. R2-26 TaxID=3144417 RepID=UPI003EE735CA